MFESNLSNSLDPSDYLSSTLIAGKEGKEYHVVAELNDIGIENTDRAFGYEPIDKSRDWALFQIQVEGEKNLIETREKLLTLPMTNGDFLKDLVSIGQRLEKYAGDDLANIPMSRLQIKFSLDDNKFVMTLLPNLLGALFNPQEKYLERIEKRTPKNFNLDK